MEKKVIALIRTSTKTQEVESQKDELLQYIYNDGIAPNNIIVVGGEGASAIKVDDQYKKNIAKVYGLIDGGNISAVYAWAIDRIGRNEEILFEFKNFLISHNVQLIIKNPSLRLMDDNGAVNKGIEIAFSLFATMAKQEMESKKERFKRAKKRNALGGYFNGGKVHFGYALTKDLKGYKIIVNQSEAEVVKLIYTLYASGEYSTPKLTTELQKRGFKIRGKNVTLHFVMNMLKSTAFIGYSVWNDVKRVYPRIISDDLFWRVQDRLKANHKGDITRQSKHIYLASKLIVCPQCGRHFFASNRNYKCYGNKYNGTNLVNHQTCPNTDNVSTEWVDVAAWYVAQTAEIKWIMNHTQSKVEQAQNQIEINDQKINKIKADLEKIDERKKRVAFNYENELITRKEMEQRTARIKEEVRQMKSEIISLQEENEKLNNVAHFSEEGTLIRFGRLGVSGIYEDAEKAYQITHKHISKIVVKPFEYEGKMQKIIEITTILGKMKRFLYMPKYKVKNNGTIYKLFEERDGKFVQLIANADFVPFDVTEVNTAD